MSARDLAAQIVEVVQSELGGRKGLDWYEVIDDEDIIEELRATLTDKVAEMIEDHARSTGGAA